MVRNVTKLLGFILLFAIFAIGIAWPDADRLIREEIIQFRHKATPANPPSGSMRVYCKSDDKCYTLDSAGNEVELGAGVDLNSQLEALFGTTPGTILYHNGTSWVSFEPGADNTVLSVDDALPGKLSYDQVTNDKMANMATLTIKSNVTGGAAAPSDNTIDTILDANFGSAAGTIMYHNGVQWTSLEPGADNTVLTVDTGLPGMLSYEAPTGGSGSLRVFRVAFGGATEGTNQCSASPCTIYRQHDDEGNTNTVSQVSWDATGRYTISITGGRCSAPPSCGGTAGPATGGAWVAYNNSAGNPTTTTYGIRINDDTGNSINGDANVVCTCLK